MHVLPPENLAYEQSVYSPTLRALGQTVSEIWARLLRVPDRFVKLNPTVFLNPEITSQEYVDRYDPGLTATAGGA